VAMDNPPAHEVGGVRKTIGGARAELRLPRACSPDLNPIEFALPQLKSHPRKSAGRTVPALWDRIGQRLDEITPRACAAASARRQGRRYITSELAPFKATPSVPRLWRICINRESVGSEFAAGASDTRRRGSRYAATVCIADGVKPSQDAVADVVHPRMDCLDRVPRGGDMNWSRIAFGLLVVFYAALGQSQARDLADMSSEEIRALQQRLTDAGW